MKYQAITCVWEVTMGCNMRCGHCGSSCEKPLPEELTTDEALDLCDQLARLGLRWVTLSGGEPTTRKDLPRLVERLSSQGIRVNIITNGWLMTDELAETLKEHGVSTVAISVDGTREIHDRVRREEAFSHVEQAFSALKKQGITTGAVTTLTKINLPILNELKEELIRIGADSWQVQIGLPMGNLKERPDWVIDPKQISDIINFCYDTALEGRIKIFPADCIGYYSRKDIETKRISFGSPTPSYWDGCNAGVRSFGILHDGRILGCTSIRDEEYIEGSIRQRPLRDIWEDENAFAWRRKMNKDQLAGKCKSCVYGQKCLGGCPNTRLTMEGSIYGENRYCLYNLSMNEMEQKYRGESDPQRLFAIGDALVRAGSNQEATYAFARLLQIAPDHLDGWLAKAYAEYCCGNFAQCLADNKEALRLDDGNVSALEGYATALMALGRQAEAVQYMEKAAASPGPRQPEMRENLRIMRTGIPV